MIDLDNIRLKRVTRGELSFYKRERTGITRRRSSTPGWNEPRSTVVGGDTDQRIERPRRRGGRVRLAVCAADKAEAWGWLLEVGTANHECRRLADVFSIRPHGRIYGTG